MPSRSEAARDDKNSTKAQAAEHANAFALGKLTLSELYKITGPKMLEAAVRGYTLYEQREYAEAEKAFRVLSVLNPREPYYMTALGAAYLAQEKLDEALRSFTYSISLSAKDTTAFVNRGEVFFQKNMLEEAVDDFTRAIELNPTGDDGVVHRARMLREAALEALDFKRDRPAPVKRKRAAAKSSSKPKKKKK